MHIHSCRRRRDIASLFWTFWWLLPCFPSFEPLQKLELAFSFHARVVKDKKDLIKALPYLLSRNDWELVVSHTKLNAKWRDCKLVVKNCWFLCFLLTVQQEILKLLQSKRCILNVHNNPLIDQCTVRVCLLISFDVFRCFLLSFDVFQRLSMPFGAFWCLSMSYDVFRSFLMSFVVFWCLLICFNVFWCLLMPFDVLLMSFEEEIFSIYWPEIRNSNLPNKIFS